MWDGRLGEIKATEPRIDLIPDTAPPLQMPYRQGLAMYDKKAHSVQEQLEAGVIEPATSEWASPVVFVPKQDGTMWFCVDYRRLTQSSVSHTYPLPRKATA